MANEAREIQAFYEGKGFKKIYPEPGNLDFYHYEKYFEDQNGVGLEVDIVSDPVDDGSQTPIVWWDQEVYVEVYYDGDLLAKVKTTARKALVG